MFVDLRALAGRGLRLLVHDRLTRAYRSIHMAKSCRQYRCHGYCRVNSLGEFELSVADGELGLLATFRKWPTFELGTAWSGYIIEQYRLRL
jgi:hypothetical protein